MIRCLFLLAAVLLVGSPAFSDEPARPLPLVLVHGAAAEHWLLCLAKDCVRLESLVPSPAEGGERMAAERNVRRIEVPDAFVTSPGADDMFSRFWSERLRNQGPIEMVTLDSSRTVNRWEHQRRCVQQVHDLLVKLCPEAKATLGERMRVELLRQQQLGERNEPLASR